MTDALSTAHFGCLKGPTAPAYPGVSTFSAHMGFVSIVVFEDSEIDFRHVHAVLVIAATSEPTPGSVKPKQAIFSPRD